jgi:hypothetical protein
MTACKHLCAVLHTAWWASPQALYASVCAVLHTAAWWAGPKIIDASMCAVLHTVAWWAGLQTLNASVCAVLHTFARWPGPLKRSPVMVKFWCVQDCCEALERDQDGSLTP